jgi:hypothetical protein
MIDEAAIRARAIPDEDVWYLGDLADAKRDIRDLLAFLDAARRERDEARAWQAAKAEWIDVADRTLKVLLASAERLRADRDALRAALQNADDKLKRSLDCETELEARGLVLLARAVIRDAQALLKEKGE